MTLPAAYLWRFLCAKHGALRPIFD